MRARSAVTGSPPMVLPKQGELVLGALEVLRGEQFAQVDGFAACVGQFDADRVAAGEHGHGRRRPTWSGRCRRSAR